jgi:hypothetical protein
VHLVGHSSSGPSEVYLALQHPGVARTVTWVAGGAGFRTGESNRLSGILSKCPSDRLGDEYRNCFRLAARSSARSPDTFFA